MARRIYTSVYDQSKSIYVFPMQMGIHFLGRVRAPAIVYTRAGGC